MSNFGQRLKALRKKLGWTQTEFGEKTEINPVQIRKYETSVSIPSTEILARIASTDVNLNWLVTGDGEMFENVEQTHTISMKLSSYKKQLDNILELLSEMDDDKRNSILQEMQNRMLEVKQMQEMEKTLENLKKTIKEK